MTSRKMILHMRSLFYTIVITGLFSSAAHADVDFRRSTSYFDIKGNTWNEIINNLKALGPSSERGKRHSGLTEIQLGGRFTYAQQGALCGFKTILVTAKVKVILPRLKDLENKDKIIAALWRALLSDITRHEDHHVQIARTQANAIDQKLHQLKPRPTCAKMRQYVSNFMDERFKEHRRLQNAFDDREYVDADARVERLMRKNIDALTNDPKP